MLLLSFPLPIIRKMMDISDSGATAIFYLQHPWFFCEATCVDTHWFFESLWLVYFLVHHTHTPH